MISIDFNKLKKYFFSPRYILAAFGVVFLLSFFIFLGSHRKSKVLLFFPTDDPTEVHGDYHIIPKGDTEEESMKILLSEVLLEPFDYRLNRIVPQGVRVNSLMISQEKTVFIDLSIEMIGEKDMIPTAKESQLMLDTIEKNLLFNFKNIRSIQFSVDGEVPFLPYFSKGSE